MVFERFNEHLPHFQFKADFLSYCSCQRAKFENIYTFTTLNKMLNSREMISTVSQTCQDESGVSKVLNTEEKKNEKISSTENLSSWEKERNVLKGKNIISPIGVKLEGKFVCENVINFSRRNLCFP